MTYRRMTQDENFASRPPIPSTVQASHAANPEQEEAKKNEKGAPVKSMSRYLFRGSEPS